MTDSRQLALAAARAAAAKQGHDVVVLEMRDLLVITDYFVIASGGSDRHVKTLAEEIERALKDLGQKPVRREGEQAGRWVLLDYVDFVAHVFTDEDRRYYDLERLWGDAPRVAWDGQAQASEG